MVPRHTGAVLAGSGTSALRVSRPHALDSWQLAVAPSANDDSTPVCGTKDWYARPESAEVEHSDSRHIRKTSIFDDASRAAATSGYGGSPASGISEAFSMHKSIVTESPRPMLFGLHGVKPRQIVGTNDPEAEHTLISLH